MPKFVIERELAGAGKLTAQELIGKALAESRTPSPRNVFARCAALLLAAGGYGCQEATSRGAPAGTPPTQTAPSHAPELGKETASSMQQRLRPLVLALRSGDRARAEALLRNDPGLAHARTTLGSTALHAAAFDGDTATVAFLLDKGADVNAVSKYGTTALHSISGAFVPDRAPGAFAQVATLLLARGADPAIRDNRGRTARDLAIANKRRDIGALLRGHGQTAEPR